LFEIVPGLNAYGVAPIHTYSVGLMTTYDKRVILFLNATQELPVDIQMEILKHYPRPQVSQRMQGFLDRWKAHRANV
tara:strand:+ start:320 stop:550 length:231 start_codon:yes stop_codon:yes gene_type:complete